MKLIKDSGRVNTHDAWGRDTWYYGKIYEIEADDVGRTFENHHGYRKPGYTIRRSDVGRMVNFMTDDTAWNCWHFTLTL